MAVSNEYLIQKETLTAIADEVRTLSGATVDMNPSEMTANISVANTEVSSQYALLEQAIAALEGKAAGGIELPELTSPAANYEVFSGKEYIDRYGNKTTGSFSIDNELSQQDNLIAQIQSALEGRAIGGSGGIDTSDATATASDIAKDKTAYVNGQKITGSVVVAESGQTAYMVNPTVSYDSSNGQIEKVAQTVTKILLRSGSNIHVDTNASTFGDATTADVAKGKTFTSINGLKLTGTASSGGGLPVGVTCLASGTYTPTQDISSGVEIEHGLGLTPNFFIWWLEEDVSRNPTAYLLTQGALIAKVAQYNTESSIIYTLAYMLAGYNSSPQYGSTTNRVSNSTYMTSTICRMHSSSTYKLLAGHKYRWIAGVAYGVL